MHFCRQIRSAAKENNLAAEKSPPQRSSDVFAFYTHRTVLESEGAGLKVTDCSLPLRCNAYIEEKGEEGYEGDEGETGGGLSCCVV